MALKTSNKNRKKSEQIKIQEVNLEHEKFAKEFTKYYTFVAIFLVIVYMIL